MCLALPKVSLKEVSLCKMKRTVRSSSQIVCLGCMAVGWWGEEGPHLKDQEFQKLVFNPSFLVLQYMPMILAIHCWHVDIEFARENRGKHVADFDAW